MELPCADKVVFETKAEAEGAALVAQNKYGGKKAKVYKCRYCERWHLATDFDD